MKKGLIIILAVCGCFFANNTLGNSLSTALISKELSPANTEEIQINSAGPKPGKNKGMRRMRNKIFTVNVFNYNKRIREKRDKELKVLAKNKKSPKARKANKNSKHILLRNNDANHGFKNKRRW